MHISRADAVDVKSPLEGSWNPVLALAMVSDYSFSS